MRLKARSAWPDFSSQEIRPKLSLSVTSVSSREPAHAGERARDPLRGCDKQQYRPGERMTRRPKD
jgi:hypothetical protein